MQETSNIYIFEKFKRKKTGIRKKAKTVQIFFQLKFDEIGAFLTVTDQNGKPVETRHEQYSGHTRDVLKSIEIIRERNSFTINWESSEKKLYFEDNEFLVWQLRHCDNFVDKDFNPICFIPEKANLLLRITPVESNTKTSNNLQSRLLLSCQGETYANIRLINENHVFAQGKVFHTNPVSEHYKDIHHFETQVPATQLEHFLSLLYSYVDHIAVKYQDYQLKEGEPQRTTPSLVFEKVDPERSLFLRVSSALKGFDPEFFDDYDISRIAVLNDLEKMIVISDVLQEEIFACFQDIRHSLNKHKKKAQTRNQYYIEDNLIIIEENLAKEFLYNELTHLITRYTIFGAENLHSYRVKTVDPKLKLNLDHGIDFLKGNAEIEIESQQFSLFDVIRQYNKQSYVTLADGTQAIINQDYINKLKRIFKKEKKGVKVSFFDLPIIEDLIDEHVANHSLKLSTDIFLGFNTFHKTKPRLPQLNVTLRNYQKLGFKWMTYLKKHGLGGCLADDMGLGKTLQAIAVLAKAYPKGKKKSLIIMPKSLLFNWANEIDKFAPHLSYYTYHGLNRDFQAAQKEMLILTTYATVRNDIELMREIPFFYIILDESQNIKNINAQTTKAIMLLNAEHRLALSGTPVENNLGELYSLFRFLNPSMFGALDHFQKNYIVPIQKHNDRAILYELKRKIYPFILRRLKQDVLDDLPEKVEQVLYVEMTPEHQQFYEQRRIFYYETLKQQIREEGIGKSQFSILQALGELRQIASVPESKTNGTMISLKREILVEKLKDAIANNHKVLVFANYLNALENISEELNTSGIEHLTMTGSTKDRKILVEKFQNDDQYKVFLLTLKTGGIGLNLTAADYIFIYDPWWNVAAENQAVDRSHRIGQDKTVFSYKLITKNTIEEKILELQVLKKELFDHLITNDSASLKSLNEQDLEFVLGG